MLRSTFIVFLLGWAVWFWIDKPPPEQQHLPPVSDSLVENFQAAFNILKSGHLEVAFVYIWNAHYLLLSLLGGALVAVTYGAISDYLSRQRMRRHIMPPSPVARETGNRDKDSPPEQPSAPTDE